MMRPEQRRARRRYYSEAAHLRRGTHKQASSPARNGVLRYAARHTSAPVRRIP